MFDKRRDTNNDPIGAPAQTAPPPVSGASGRANPAPRATIGPTIVISGQISGQEDMIVAGKCDGTISLPDNTVTVVSEGHVRANVAANVVQIEGQVEGDVDGMDKVVISATGRMEGNIKAPRVILNDGAKFKGSIDMDPGIEARKPAEPKPSAPKPKLTGDGRPIPMDAGGAPTTTPRPRGGSS